MLIRTPVSADIPCINRLFIQLGYPVQPDSFLLQRIERTVEQGYRVLVAEIDQEVIGFISMHWFEFFHQEGNVGRISAFCVDEKFRSQGIGLRLMDEAEVFLRSKGCLKIEVTSNLKRIKTHDFYLRRGYVEDSKRFVKYFPA
jgi:GNAT superfamily N-acetyltransferase